MCWSQILRLNSPVGRTFWVTGKKRRGYGDGGEVERDEGKEGVGVSEQLIMEIGRASCRERVL